MLSEGCVKYDFTGGNNDPDRLPLDGLTAPADAVLKREGRSLSTYGLNSGPQGYLALREFLVAKLKAEAPLPVGRSAKSSCLRPRHFPQKPSQPPYLDERKLVVGCGLGGKPRTRAA